jgi:hypothetical protein
MMQDWIINELRWAVLCSLDEENGNAMSAYIYARCWGGLCSRGWR